MLERFKYILLFTILVAASSETKAIPAKRGPFVFSQPDVQKY